VLSGRHDCAFPAGRRVCGQDRWPHGRTGANRYSTPPLQRPLAAAPGSPTGRPTDKGVTMRASRGVAPRGCWWISHPGARFGGLPTFRGHALWADTRLFPNPQLLLLVEPGEHRLPPVPDVAAEPHVREQARPCVLPNPPLRHRQHRRDLTRVEETILVSGAPGLDERKAAGRTTGDAGQTITTSA
jgi:hypothetical protein